MENKLIISKYISIRSNSIRLNGDVVFTDEVESFRDFIKRAYRHFKVGYSKFFKMDQLSKLAFMAAELLLSDVPITDRYPAESIGIILQNRASSLDTDLKHQDSIHDRDNYFPSPSIFVYTLPNIMAGEISIKHKIKGENSIFVAEQFEPEFIYTYINDLFEKNAIDCCLAGWVDYYQGKYEAFMMLVEREVFFKNEAETDDYIIFEASEIENLYLKNNRHE